MKSLLFDVRLVDPDTDSAYPEVIVDGKYIVAVDPGSPYKIVVTVHFRNIPQNSQGQPPQFVEIAATVDGKKLEWVLDATSKKPQCVFSGFCDSMGNVQAFYVERTKIEPTESSNGSKAEVDLGSIEIYGTVVYSYIDQGMAVGDEFEDDAGAEGKITKKGGDLLNQASLFSTTGEYTGEIIDLQSSRDFAFVDYFDFPVVMLYYHTPGTVKLMQRQTGAIAGQKRSFEQSQVIDLTGGPSASSSSSSSSSSNQRSIKSSPPILVDVETGAVQEASFAISATPPMQPQAVDSDSEDDK